MTLLPAPLLADPSRRLFTRTGFFSPSLDGGLPLFELFNPSRRSSSAIRAFSDAFSALSAAISALSSSRDGSLSASRIIRFLNRKPVRPSREIYRQFTSRSPNLGSNEIYMQYAPGAATAPGVRRRAGCCAGPSRVLRVAVLTPGETNGLRMCVLVLKACRRSRMLCFSAMSR